MTLINLTNQSYNINLSAMYNGSSTLYVMPLSIADYPDSLADEPEIKAKADKEIFCIVRNAAIVKPDKNALTQGDAKQSMFSKLKPK